MPAPESVAIFWDYENCALPASALGNPPTATIVARIRQLALKYGSVKTFNVYLELPEQQNTKNKTLRSEIVSCGVHLVDCPHNGSKDVADKMIIVDMMTFAMDTPAPATIVLITGDRDFVYAVSVLCNRQYRVVILAPNVASASLKAQATELHAWPRCVLPEGATQNAKHRASVSSTSNADSSRSSVEASARAAPQPVQPAITVTTLPPSPLDVENRSSDGSSLLSFATPLESLNAPETPMTGSTAVDSEPDTSPQSTSYFGSLLVDRSEKDSSISRWSNYSSNLDDPYGHADLPDEESPYDDNTNDSSEESPYSPSYLHQLSDLLPQLNANSLPYNYQHAGDSAHPSQANASTSTGRVAAPFKPLVKVLRKQREEGVRKVAFSELGTLLRRQCETVYERAGVTKLKEYITLAEEADVVVIHDNSRGPGGIDGQRWVSLHPRLLQGVSIPAKVETSLDSWWAARMGGQVWS